MIIFNFGPNREPEERFAKHPTLGGKTLVDDLNPALPYGFRVEGLGFTIT